MKNWEKLDHVNRQLLTLIQQGLPIVPEPYRELADRLGISQEEVFERIDSLKKAGIVRRISGFFDSGRMGYHSILCAMEVPEERVETVAAFLDAIPGITHNYLRDYRLNMWFTLCCESEQALDEMIRRIEEGCAAGPVHRFPRVKAYKIRASFNLKEETT